MSDATIRETTVALDEAGAIVRLHISDAQPPEEFRAIEVRLAVRIPASTLPLLAQLERAAMEAVQQTLSTLLQQRAEELQAAHQGLLPRPKA